MEIDEENNCNRNQKACKIANGDSSLNRDQENQEVHVMNSLENDYTNISNNGENVAKIQNKDLNEGKTGYCNKQESTKISSDQKESLENESNDNPKTLDIENDFEANRSDSHQSKKDDSAENVLTAADSLLLSDSDNEEISTSRKNIKRKKFAIDSDQEDNDQSPKKESLISKYRGLIDSDSEPEAHTNEKSMETDKNDNKKSKFSSLIDSESEPEEKIKNDSPEKSSNDKKKKFSAIIDSESDSENSDDNQEEDVKPRKGPPKRASAKAALDEIAAIKSETQRLHRENYVSVPYHKPKQYSLQEFLTRKTIAKPGAVKGSNLKMSTEELEKFAKHLEERAKEATEFFKGDSDNDEKEDKIQDSSETKEEKNEEKQEIPSTSKIIEEQPSKEEGAEEEGFSLFEHSQPPPLQVNPEEKCNEASTSNIKKILADVDLYPSPSLKGDPNMLIDLDTGDLISPKPTGVDNLLQRFLKNSAKRKLKATDNVNILTVENGKVEMKKVPVLIQEKSNGVEPKPGSAYFKLKNNLKSIIANKRREELLKKVQSNSVEKEVKGKSLDDDEDEERESMEDIDEIEKADYNELEEEIMEVDENESLLNNEAEEYGDAEDEGEADSDFEADDEGDADNNNDDNEEDKDSLENQSKKSKSRIIAAFEDSDDEAERANKSIDDILTKFHIVENEPENHLWGNEEPTNSDDENELLGLCSGRFVTQRPGITQITQVDEDHSVGLSSLTQNDDGEKKQDIHDHATPPKEKLRLESSDDEYENTERVDERKTKKKQKRKLGFSDDEEETENDEDLEIEEMNNEIGDTNENDDEEEPVETYIDYDSEENEIEVEMNKEQRVAHVKTFFENEAELSESEWGSADEDEKDMDRYDIEFGDEDQFDKQKIRRELEQIHLRKMLDDDLRDVRKMKEMFLEDEEDEGAKRQRQFRWKYSENGFSLDNPNTADPNAGNPTAEADDENEELWRKMRHERELLLKEKQNENQNTESPEVPTIANSLVATTKKITIIKKIKPKNSENVSQSGVDSPFLISKVTKSGVRGSFLIRDKETLTKLASITKSDSDGVTGVTPGNSRNFIFARLSEEQMALKRKSSPELLKDDEDGNQLKKQKISDDEGRKKRLIDHLL